MGVEAAAPAQIHGRAHRYLSRLSQWAPKDGRATATLQPGYAGRAHESVEEAGEAAAPRPAERVMDGRLLRLSTLAFRCIRVCSSPQRSMRVAGEKKKKNVVYVWRRRALATYASLFCPRLTASAKRRLSTAGRRRLIVARSQAACRVDLARGGATRRTFRQNQRKFRPGRFPRERTAFELWRFRAKWGGGGR